MTSTLNIEILSHEEAEDYFKRQIDETHIAPYVDLLSRLEIGDAFRAPIQKGEDGESARTMKRNLNTASKLRRASEVVRDAVDEKDKPEAAPEGTYRSIVTMEDGSRKAVFKRLTDTLAPVQLRWKADTHNEKKEVTKDGKKSTVDVVIVDKLVAKLVASAVQTTAVAPTQPATGPSADTIGQAAFRDVMSGPKLEGETDAQQMARATEAAKAASEAAQPNPNDNAPEATPLTDEQNEWAASLTEDQARGLAEHAQDNDESAAEYARYLQWQAQGGTPEADSGSLEPSGEGGHAPGESLQQSPTSDGLGIEPNGAPPDVVPQREAATPRKR